MKQKRFIGFVDGICKCYNCQKEKKVLRVIFPAKNIHQVEFFQICEKCYKEIFDEISKFFKQGDKK